MFPSALDNSHQFCVDSESPGGSSHKIEGYGYSTVVLFFCGVVKIVKLLYPFPLVL